MYDPTRSIVPNSAPFCYLQVDIYFRSAVSKNFWSQAVYLMWRNHIRTFYLPPVAQNLFIFMPKYSGLQTSASLCSLEQPFSFITLLQLHYNAPTFDNWLFYIRSIPNAGRFSICPPTAVFNDSSFSPSNNAFVIIIRLLFFSFPSCIIPNAGADTTSEGNRILMQAVGLLRNCSPWGMYQP